MLVIINMIDSIGLLEELFLRVFVPSGHSAKETLLNEL